MKFNTVIFISVMTLLGCADKENNKTAEQKASKTQMAAEEVSAIELSTPEKTAMDFIENLLVKGDFKAALQLTADEANKQLKWMMTDEKAIASFSQLSNVTYNVVSVELDTNKATGVEFALVLLNIKATVKGVKQDDVQNFKLKKIEGKWLIGRM
ncbi:MAG: hypothetical protein HRU38_21015 [Saccharospirillaceae bacterium]|nr:hypothetical protein [Pseudomonadales bacterium]NRB81113.1 hypothetical protein [Saccharospirillaceae bacterium]